MDTSNNVMSFNMNDVLNGKIPHTEAVLYASKINKSAVLSSLRELKQNASDTIRTTDEMIKTIDDGLQETNSERFYKNTMAVNQIQNMNTLSQDMKKFMDLLGNMDENRIGSIIDAYNAALFELKKKTRQELLEAAAEQANGHKLIKSEVTRKFYPDNGVNHSYYHEEKNGTTKVVTKRYASGLKNENGDDEYITKVDTYVWVQCTGDPSTIEARFQSAGISLPYNPSKIVDFNL